jgi:hypothetical protein
VWVEILPPFDTSNPIINLDVWDGETVEQELSRGMIATKLILDKPKKIRFVRSSILTDKDLDKLALVATSASYTLLIDEKFLSFTYTEPTDD